jgi:uncharacterized MnhB-related membrane protein
LWIKRCGGSHPAVLVSTFLALAAAIYILLLAPDVDSFADASLCVVCAGLT